MTFDPASEEVTRRLFADIVDAQERFARLEAGLASGDDDLLVEVTVTELRTAMEELAVAGEELDAQNNELVTTREEVERQRRRYQELFSSAPDAYLVSDAYGLLQEANAAAAELLRVPPRFLPGKTLALFVAEEDRRDFRGALAMLPAGGGVQRWPVRMVRRDGTPFAGEVTVGALFDRDGRVEEVRWQVRDVSDRVHLENELRRLNGSLEVKVSERTEQLSTANQRLTDALARVSTLSEQLQHALESRVTIEQAKGRLMEALQIGAEPAFELIRRRARDTGRKLRDVAQEVVDGSLRLDEQPPSSARRRGVNRPSARRQEEPAPHPGSV